MRVHIHHNCAEAESYRAARVKSLFNVESGTSFEFEAELPLEGWPWRIGVVVGPSGSGKTSIGQALGRLYAPRWPKHVPIVDAITPEAGFDAVTAALSAVGLGPQRRVSQYVQRALGGDQRWSRPEHFHCLGNSQQAYDWHVHAHLCPNRPA